MKEISVQELNDRISKKSPFQLIDIREDWEVERSSIGGEHIPMGEVCKNINKFKKDRPVIIHCKSGSRSSKMVQFLEDNYELDNIYSLKGGIVAWAEKVDQTLKID